MSKIDIRVDKRIELASVLLLLSDENNYYIKKCEANANYLNSIKNYFEKFKQEKAVEIIQKYIKLLRQQYGINAGGSLFSLMLKLDDNLAPNPNFESVGLYINEFWSGLKQELPHFLKVSNFEEFYNSNLPMYQTLIKNAKQDVDLDKIDQFMCYFYGEDYDVNQLRILDLCPTINPCTSRKTKDGVQVCVCALDDDEKDMAFIGATKKTSSSVVHEFSHPIINPLIEKHNPIPTEFYSEIIPKVKSTIGNHETYGLTVELTVRALQIVYLRHMYNDKPEWAEWKLNHNKQVIGFGGFMDLFIEKLDNFYINRNKYNNFKGYLPTMLEEIKNTKIINEETKPL